MKAAESKTNTDSAYSAPFISGVGQKAHFFAHFSQAHSPFFGPNTIQPKLKIGQPNDKYEREADRVAHDVMRMPDPTVQRQPEEEEQLQMQRQEPGIQLKCADCEKEKKLQKKAEVKTSGSGESIAGQQLSSQIKSTAGNGHPLPGAVQSEMSQKIGADFSGVNIHTGSDAHQMNRQVGARAFTHGSDIYFNKGEYSPASNSGKRLLAHELTHVVQQGGNRGWAKVQRTIGDGHDLFSPRFAGNPELESAYDVGEPNVEQGQSGIHVRVIQQALVDSGQTLPTYGVDGDFGDETKSAIESFQRSVGLTGVDVTGIIDEQTMTELDQYFQDYSPMAQIAQTVPPGSETRTLTAGEITEVERLRTSEVTAPPSGSLPTFDPDKHGPDCYENEVKTRVLQVVNTYHARAVAQESARGDPSNIHDWSFIEHIADAAKQETDRVFGSYYTVGAMPAFRHGVNLFEARQDKESQYTAAGAPFADRRVSWRVQKIIQGPYIHPIDVDHGAVQSRAAESNILDRIKTQVASTKRSELILIDKWWSGYADPSSSSVYLQRMKAADDAGNRNFAWDMFQTMVHEYIHTLEHPDSRTYRQSLPETRGGKTYREGMTEYFTKIVLNDISYTAALRNRVEGPYHNPAITHTIPTYSGYAEAQNAEAVVGLVGINNVLAAFFDGDVHLIGGPGGP